MDTTDKTDAMRAVIKDPGASTPGVFAPNPGVPTSGGPTPGPPIVALSGLSKQYSLGKTTVDALKAVSLSINKGDFVSVAGPSGSGKTTMMNIIGLIDLPTAGSLAINGRKAESLSRRDRTRMRHQVLGFIFQSFNLLPVLTVEENVELPLLIGKNRLPADQRREWVQHLIEQVGLSDRRGHKPAELSGGQQQRVAVARALVTRPAIVIADEPTANLDSVTGERILELMKRINREEGTTFIFSTHDPAIRDIAGHVVNLKDGEIASEIRR